MRTTILFRWLRGWGAAVGLLCLGVTGPMWAATDQPVITSVRVRGTNLQVTVQVPAQLRSVTLEARSQVGRGGWEPRAVWRLAGTETERTFTLPRSAGMEVLRVRATERAPLPAAFYQGATSFAGPASADLNGLVATASTTAGPGAYPTDTTTGGGGSTARSVVESDIWKLEGNTLYFFNAYRGLQVIDLSTPSSPVLRGTLALPAAGDQMYAVGTNYVILLTHDGCGGADSQVLVVDVQSLPPTVVTTLPLGGSVAESRLVGTALYVATQKYVQRSDAGGIVSEWGTQIASFDLARPAAPVARDSLWYPGYNVVVTATDRFLFAATYDYNQTSGSETVVRCIDIAAPNGAMRPLASIPVAGSVADKFKMNEADDVLRVISTRWVNGSTINLLETFSLAHPAEPVKLGELEIGHGESLFATRFDGARAYVVTYRRIDPLWVVDLSDPRLPRVTGELRVPGWSTFIQPLGDRLVTVGIDDTNGWRVAVQLFDVRDPAQPALLSKVPLGESQSWSEATHDEKAFNVLPDAGLILVPYSAWESNGLATAVQLIDLGTNSLTPRGVITHPTYPRRATLSGDFIYSISGRELLSVEATDRDHPLVRSTTPLAWPVGQVFLQGDYLVELENLAPASWGYYWAAPLVELGSQTAPWVRVASAADPNNVLAVYALSRPEPLLGATVREGKLYIAQGQSVVWGGPWMPIIMPLAATQSTPALGETTPPNLFLTVLDLGRLPELRELGQTGVAAATSVSGGSLEALWPRPGVLVWVAQQSDYRWWFSPMATDNLILPACLGCIPRWSSGSARQLVAFDVTAAAAPQFLSSVKLASTNGTWWGFGRAFSAGGMVYLSHQTGESFAYGVAPTDLSSAGNNTVAGSPTVLTRWVQRTYLDVVDYADPALPLVRTPVNIPNPLLGLSHDGAILYTVGPHYDALTSSSDGREWVEACAYDGVVASLVTSLALPTSWPHPSLVQAQAVLLGRPATTNAPAQLEAWTLSETTGRFTQLGSWPLPDAATSLAALDELLVVQASGKFFLFDHAGAPATLRQVGAGTVPTCYYYYQDLRRADGTATRGLWLPLGDYGVWTLPVKGLSTWP